MTTAREPDSVLCPLDAIPDGQARGFTVGGGQRRLVLVARQGEAVHGYVNACPHAGTPLDWVEDRFMSPDGTHLQCATHGAQFRVEDGYCVLGPCAGDRLDPAPVRLEGGLVVLCGDPQGRDRGGHHGVGPERDPEHAPTRPASGAVTGR